MRVVRAICSDPYQSREMRHLLQRSSALRSFSVVLSRPSTLLQPQLQTRTFIDSILSSALGPCPLRNLTHTKTLPYSASSIFQAVSDVSGYPSFLPFTVDSRVTARDTHGYPERASLKIGYEAFGLEEVWESKVRCDAEKGIVEAQSSEANSRGLFEVLQTRWHIQPAQPAPGSETATSVKLDLDVKFRNPVYDQMFAQVEGQVASVMINAFERRVQELEAAKR